MSKKIKKFTDDGWAVWVEGEDSSTVYLNCWINPKGESFVDVSVKIVGIKETKGLNVYVPFRIEQSEIEDISLKYKSERIARATFSAGCLIDYQKNEHTSEIAYNGKTVDIVHLSKNFYEVSSVGKGTLIRVDFGELMKYIENDESYFAFRIPHKTLNEVFKTYSSVKSFLGRMREMLTSPILYEKYGYSVRINEARLLPKEINSKGAFHRQKLKGTTVSIALSEKYEISDGNCTSIRRLEENLYRDFAPKGFKCNLAINYQWTQINKTSERGQFSFYFNITKNAVSKLSLIFYLAIVVVFGAMGNALWDLVKFLIGIY